MSTLFQSIHPYLLSILYILTFTCITDAQTDQLIYSSTFGDQRDNWVEISYGNSVIWSTNCSQLTTTTTCVNVEGECYIEHRISTVGYHQIRLVVDVAQVNLNSLESCIMTYRSDSTSWSTDRSTVLVQRNDPPVLDYEIDVPHDVPGYNDEYSFKIRLQNTGNSQNDDCYFGNLRVYGMDGAFTYSPTTAQPTTAKPTPKPTPKPTQKPTPNPTKRSTNLPTKIPTNNPVNAPIIDPTTVPSKSPTARPTLPPLITCGDQLLGDYNDEAIAFDVRLPYDGHLTFDASASTFAIQSVNAAFGGTPMRSAFDGVLTLSNAMAADYTFTLKAANGIYGTFKVDIACQSNSPTKRPSDAPIKPGSPTRGPTLHTPLPSHSPTLYPVNSLTTQGTAYVMTDSAAQSRSTIVDVSSTVDPSNPSTSSTTNDKNPSDEFALNVSWEALVIVILALATICCCCIIAGGCFCRVRKMKRHKQIPGNDMAIIKSNTTDHMANIVRVPSPIIQMKHMEGPGAAGNNGEDDSSEGDIVLDGMGLTEEGGREFDNCGYNNTVQDMVHRNNDDLETPTRQVNENALNAVRAWLTTSCQLPQYYETFVSNGYDCMNIINKISGRQELKEIKIRNMVHRNKIWNEILNLKVCARDTANEQTKNEDNHNDAVQQMIEGNILRRNNDMQNTDGFIARGDEISTKKK
eukprot:1151017_1